MGSLLLQSLITLVFLLTHPTPISGNVELRTLLQLKSTLDPQNKLLSSWTSSGDPCSSSGDFEGVACNENGKVVNISLQGKGLSGFISPSISELKCLSGLYLHYNAISGKIPGEIGNLTELSELYLNVNNLSGRIPEEIGNLGGLQVLQLCCNQLTGSIPTQLGLLKKLNVLTLQSNHLTGAIPASLGDISQLVRLDLSFNQLFGPIPTMLAQLPTLRVLDVRNNSLSGNAPSDLKRLSGGFQYDNNKDLCGTEFSSLRVCTSANLLDPDRPEPYDSQGIPQSANVNITCNNAHCSNSSRSSVVAVSVGVLAAVVALAVAGLLSFSWYRRQKQKIGDSLEVLDNRLIADPHMDSYRRSASPLVSLEYSNRWESWDPLADGRSGVGFSEEVSQSFRFNLEEVEYATQYFSEVNLLGKSSFGATYKGVLRDGTVVVVKRINKTSCKTQEAEFLKGLKLLTSLHHENIVKLRGFCCSRGRGECFLIYDFVGNGKLSGYLDAKGDENGMILQWPIRVSVIKGIAKGIHYLHSNRTDKPPLVHQNISADKILIDHQFNPLLSSCGLHNLFADDVVFSTLKASAAMGYLAPEYTTIGRFTLQSDIYAFGVLLFQILTGKKIITQQLLVAEAGTVEDLIDENLRGNFSIQQVTMLTEIALLCTSEDSNQRPTAESLLQELNSIC